jgi:hypothetical protein
MPDGAPAIAIYGAGLSTALAVIRLVEFWQARQRLHFSVWRAHIVGEGERVDSTPEVVIVSIGNRAPFAVHITSVGLALRSKSALTQLRPATGSDPLPRKLEPSEGLKQIFLPGKLLERLDERDADEIVGAFAFDGSSRRYARSLTHVERQELRELLERMRAGIARENSGAKTT